MDQEEDDPDNRKDKEPEEPVPETRIEHEIPYIRADVGKEFHFVKLPNFLSVEPRPFDPETYEDELEEEDTLDEEGRARLKLKVENTIRWRTAFDKEGNAFKESNARMVKWSDGSLSLHLGSEIFDVYRQPLQVIYFIDLFCSLTRSYSLGRPQSSFYPPRYWSSRTGRFQNEVNIPSSFN